MSWFQKIIPPKIQRRVEASRKVVPEGLWSKCEACEEVLYRTELEKNLNVCPKCGHHNRISARQRLEWKMEYTNIARNILPERFSLTRLQEAYEIIFGRAFDKRNFRKKILSVGMLRETDELDRTSSNRPARLYEFADKELKIMPEL